MKLSLCIVMLLLCVIPAAAQHPPLPTPPASMSTAQWKADIDFLSSQLAKKHMNAFHKISKSEFETEVAQLKQAVPNLSREQVIAGIMKIVASIGDGHTSVPIPALRAQGFHVLPVRFYSYLDGIYIQGADRSYERAVGAKLISIDAIPAMEVFRRVSETDARDNDMTLKDRVPYYMSLAELLFGIGLTHAPEQASIVVEKNGERFTIDVHAVTMPDFGYAVPILGAFSSDWVEARGSDLSRAPLWLRNTVKNYWMQYIPESKTLYVQYNRCLQERDEPMSKFAERMRKEIAERSPDRLVLDLRLNSGGEGTLNKPLVIALIQSEKINQKGKLFAIVGRRTFSAGQSLASELEYYTNVTFVGEPTGAPPHFFGDEDSLILPNSHLLVAYAMAWWQNNTARDYRPWISPSMAADLTEGDFEHDRDPAMEAIASWAPAREGLIKDLTAANVGEFGAIVDRYRNDPTNRYLNFESVVNDTAYALLHEEKSAPAIALFKINVQNYPRSANAYDSLGEAYASIGDKQAAIEAYTKALEINPDFPPSQAALKKLKGQ